MKAPSVALMLGLCPGLLLAGCGKAPSGTTGAKDAPSGRSARASRSGGGGAAGALLTKEEVGAVLGKPVTTIEGKGTDLTYKTDVLLLETSIEVERLDDVAGAIQSMQGARTATGFLGGKAEEVPGLGDEAIFGAMSTLYFRKGSNFIHIQPPNLQQMASMKAYNKVTEAKSPEETLKAMQALTDVQKTDPANAGLAAGDAAQGAVAVIAASSKKQGTQYETDARAMAVALATKVLEKL